MKTRTGFVSNSSSSSFILIFDKDPSSIDNLTEMLGECNNYDDYYGETTTEEVINRVHCDVMSKMPASIPELMDELGSNLSWDIYKQMESRRHEFIDPITGKLDTDRYYEALEAEEAKQLAPMIEKFKRENADKFVYILEYDDCGSDAFLESGSAFSNVKNIRVSHH